MNTTPFSALSGNNSLWLGYGYWRSRETFKGISYPYGLDFGIHGTTIHAFFSGSAKPTHIQSFGFATEEFEVTPERLGVYLPVVRNLLETLCVPPG